MTDISAVLSGRTALVTGGASGIGRAVAVRLSTAGAHVLVLDRDQEGAEQVAQEVGGDHLVADLSDGASNGALELGLDVRALILVHNAGIQPIVPVDEFGPERF